MNLFVLAPTWLLVILGTALLAAGFEDAFRRRISNVTVFVVLSSAVVAAILRGPELSAWENATVFVALLTVGSAMFAADMLGGGDVKLFAALGLWTDFERATILIAAIFVAGGFLTLAILSSRLIFRGADGIPLRERSRRIPYGVAIALGGLFTIALQQEIAAARHPTPLAFHSLGTVNR
jgi:prepilin peptidase CpaA